MAIRLERGKEGRERRREEGREGCTGRRYLCTMYTSGHTTMDRRVGGGGVGFRIWGYLYTMCTYTTITSL